MFLYELQRGLLNDAIFAIKSNERKENSMDINTLLYITTLNYGFANALHKSIQLWLEIYSSMYSLVTTSMLDAVHSVFEKK